MSTSGPVVRYQGVESSRTETRSMTSCTQSVYLMNAQVPEQATQDAAYRDMDAFLKGVERRAYVMAEMATRNPDDALDLVQDAMLAFVRRYAGKPQGEWAPLFHRVLQNRIRDWARRRKVRSRWTAWLQRNDEDDNDPIQQAPTPPQDPWIRRWTRKWRLKN